MVCIFSWVRTGTSEESSLHILCIVSLGATLHDALQVVLCYFQSFVILMCIMKAWQRSVCCCLCNLDVWKVFTRSITARKLLMHMFFLQWSHQNQPVVSAFVCVVSSGCLLQLIRLMMCEQEVSQLLLIKRCLS